MSLLVPEHDQHEQREDRGSSKRVWHFVVSLEPLLLECRQKRQRRLSASLDANGDEEGEAGKIDLDADWDGDTDDGIWSGVCGADYCRH